MDRRTIVCTGPASAEKGRNPENHVVTQFDFPERRLEYSLMMIRRLLLPLVLYVSVGLAAGQAPIPTTLRNAKTAFVVNDGSWYKVFDKFYGELKKWDRFRFVESKSEADIVIVLSTNAGNLGGAILIPGPGIALSGSESKFYLRIVDAHDETPLWSDYTGEALLVSNSAKKLVSNLKKRMEQKQAR